MESGGTTRHALPPAENTKPVAWLVVVVTVGVLGVVKVNDELPPITPQFSATPSTPSPNSSPTTDPFAQTPSATPGGPDCVVPPKEGTTECWTFTPAPGTSVPVGGPTVTPVPATATPSLTDPPVQFFRVMRDCTPSDRIGLYRPEDGVCQPTRAWSFTDFVAEMNRIGLTAMDDKLDAPLFVADPDCQLSIYRADNLVIGRLCFTTDGAVYRDSGNPNDRDFSYRFDHAFRWVRVIPTPSG